MKTEITPKEKLFQTAAHLFYQHGYRSTGVDTIAAEFWYRKDDAISSLPIQG